MRLLILTLIVAAVAAGSAAAQTRYSDGKPLLKRRPFAPGGVDLQQAPTIADHNWPLAYNYHPQLQTVKMPIYSPYSMIHYNLVPTPPTEKLPAPRPMGTPAPGAKPDVPKELPPKLPT